MAPAWTRESTSSSQPIGTRATPGEAATGSGVSLTEGDGDGRGLLDVCVGVGVGAGEGAAPGQHATSERTTNAMTSRAPRRLLVMRKA